MHHPGGNHLLRREQPEEAPEIRRTGERSPLAVDIVQDRPDAGSGEPRRVHGGLRQQAHTKVGRSENHSDGREVHQGDRAG